uniref:Uncharacterized protein n=1 Tax=Volvariella volvacea TaxID=36659 RepID=A0A5H2QB98_9AGAR|nr:hypothetical protein [Volvariella volvacea]AYD91359.1 hypothetical protein [Volvariella volvacea]AYD91391.1 hypothetical protein [Volvariella volvacea]AYD91420.1 hypothetical protein [Volvariella volvacea]
MHLQKVKLIIAFTSIFHRYYYLKTQNIHNNTPNLVTITKLITIGQSYAQDNMRLFDGTAELDYLNYQIFLHRFWDLLEPSDLLTLQINKRKRVFTFFNRGEDDLYELIFKSATEMWRA